MAASRPDGFMLSDQTDADSKAVGKKRSAFSHLLLHEKDEQKALKHMEQVMNYLLGGWNAMFQKQ